MYEQKHPGVVFRTVFTGWEGYWEKMAAEMAGGSPPDIMQHDHDYIGQYVDKKLLADLTPYKGNLLDLSRVSANVIASGTLGGKLYGVALGTNSEGVVYNPRLLQQAGLSAPSVDWTWQEFIANANTVHKKLAIFGTGHVMHSRGLRTFAMYLREQDQHLYSPDGRTLGYSKDGFLSDYWQMLLSLQESGGMGPVDTWTQHNSTANYLIALKQAAYERMSSNAVVAVGAAAGEPLKLAVIPSNADKGMYVKPSAFWTVTQASKKTKAAVEFVSYFANDIEANKVIATELGVAINADVRAALLPSLLPAEREQFDFMDIVEKHSRPIDPPAPPQGAEILNLFVTLTEQVLYKQTTPSAASVKFRSQAEQILSRAK